ncbi:MAG: DUF4214 domain-containing protein [Acidimicrobiales bacterium]
MTALRRPTAAPGRLLAAIALLLSMTTVVTTAVTVADPVPAGAATTGPDARSVERLYAAYFGRGADAAGLEFWQGQQALGRSLDEISESFARSPEFVDTYGTLSDADFVDLVYTNVLGRTPDAGGRDHWLTRLAAGTLSRGQVMLAFSDSAEFKETTGLHPHGPDGRSVERLYAAYFGRGADATGLAYWEGRRAQGTSLEVISENFAQSPEFVDTYGTLSDDDFVDLVYNNVLGRSPDAGGRTHWLTLLTNGTLTRGQVMLAFSDSPEYKVQTDLHGDRPVTPVGPPAEIGPNGLPTPGNPAGTAVVPAAAQAEATSAPDTVIGDGTPASCTSAAVVAAVAAGGTITFDCGPDPVTIVMTETARVFNNADPDIVIDGGGLVTLSGGGERRILYMNTCDQAQVWTTPHCQNQDHPRLTVQNIAFVDGDATGETVEGGGGGAIFVRGGRLKIVNAVFARNRCDATGPDVGGAAVRVLSQYDGLPVYVVNSTFGGGEGLGNVCSNGGGLSSIGVSMTVLNSVFSHNEAIGNGANPAQAGTPGGGSGAAIYNDGGFFELRVAGTVMTDNHANEGGGAIFFVSNDRTGHLFIDGSTLARNVSARFETAGLPGIFYLGDGPAIVTASSLS